MRRIESRARKARSKVCIIGAGASGLAAAKALAEEGIPFNCYEKGSQVGGLWRYENDNGLSACYESLRINTWKGNTAYSDFPMPEEYPIYPDHRQMAAYFDAYADRFHLRRRITFRTEVRAVHPDRDGGWSVAAGGTQRRYRAVIVANGHHWKPRRPVFPGRFEGTAIHSHEYRKADVFRERRVLVVGIGNSGVDIACDAALVAERTYLSTRRGAHVLPRFLLGMPIDKLGTGLGSRLPMPLQRAILAVVLRIERGSLSSYGLPVPDHKLLAAHPTVSAELLPLIREGKARVKPDVKELAGGRVRFTDGSEEEVDFIVWATGYDIRFPFLAPEVVPLRDGIPALYLKVVPPRCPGLFFLGLIQLVRGSIPRAAEHQARWVAALLQGRVRLPPLEEMEKAIERERRENVERFVRSPRHILQADWWPYLEALDRELQRRRPGKR